MDVPYKKILQVSLLLLATATLAILFYLVFFWPQAAPVNPPDDTTQNTGGLRPSPDTTNTGAPVTTATPTSSQDTTQSENFANLVPDNIASDPSSSTVVGYDAGLGQFFQINELGQVIPLGDAIFENLQHVTWSQNKDMAVLEYRNGTSSLYNFKTKRGIPLPSSWQEFSFDARGTAIAFKNLSPNPDDRYLATMHADGTNIRLIQPLGDGAERVHVAWSPDGQTVGFATVPVDGVRQDLIAIGPDGTQRKLGSVEGINYLAQWSPDSSKLLYSMANPYNGYRPALWVLSTNSVDPASSHVRIPLETTSDQCAFSANHKSLICVAPTEPGPTGWGLSNDGGLNQPSQLYQVELTTGSVSMIYAPTTPSILAEPTITKDNIVYIINRTTGKLQRFALP